MVVIRKQQRYWEIFLKNGKLKTTGSLGLLVRRRVPHRQGKDFPDPSTS